MQFGRRLIISLPLVCLKSDYWRNDLSIIMWHIVIDVRGNLMKITYHNLNNDGALNIGVSGLQLSASTFTGFCPFLLSRGSMAAPTAK
jgi:hypothetical protein